MLNKLMRKLKTKTGMMYGIMLLTSLVLGLSYGTFIFVTDGYKATEMLVSNLMYGIEITSTGGTETINNTNVTISNGNTSTVLVKITSLNKINSKYGLDYKILSGTGNIYYASSTGWLPTGKINKNGSGIYEKTIKVVISATSDLTVDFNVSGGYTYNSEVASKSTYTRVSEVYDNILSYTTNKLLSEIVSEEASDGIYGGDATNNYLQYPESSNANENIWRIIGNYKSVGGIKLISNSKEIISVSDINTKLTNIYNTLDKTSEYVLSTNKFNCTGTTCTTSNYSNIGLLSSSEYNSDSYMNITDNWFTTNNNVVELVSGETISSTDTTTTGSLRASIYLQGDVSIKGSGTSTDPYRLVEKGDVIISSATLNGSTLSYFPTMSSPYLVNSVTCSNGTTGTWDNKKDKIVLDNINLPTVCNVDFKDGYTVNLTSTGGSIPSSVQVGRNGIATITLKPSDGYLLEGTTTDCPNATISGSTLTIKNIKSNISCSVTFMDSSPYKTGTLAHKLMNNNSDIRERETYMEGLDEDTNGRMYKIGSTDKGQYTEDVDGDGMGEDSYYFAGNMTKNWVKFGGYYWRVIRINEDGSVRLLYSGTTPSTTSAYIGTVAYNTTKTSYMYGGYMYGTNTSLTTQRNNTTSSNVKKTIDTWYENNLKTSYDKYISKTAIYCNERAVGDDSAVDSNGAIAYHSACRTRMDDVDGRPSYRCGNKKDGSLYETMQAVADKFSASTSGGGNGKLTYPIALMTVDEMVFAGAVFGSDGYDTLWTYNNSNNASITGTSNWWTMSPSWYNQGMSLNIVYGSKNPGKLVSTNVTSTTTVVRPVISLKYCTQYSSGDGTSSNPYEVTIDDTCASAEN